jgi:transcriptional regulator with XRE-family HTH domain
MPDLPFGTWLRTERESRRVTLSTISAQTKVSVPLLQGLESGDLSRWPNGIFRRGFVRAYAAAVGLDVDEVVRRFELEHGGHTDVTEVPAPDVPAPATPTPPSPERAPTALRASSSPSKRSRALGTAADLTVAMVLALACAAAGSRLLWPVLLIAAYYALGILLTGTSPMVALLNDEPVPSSARTPDVSDPVAPRPVADRRQPQRRTPGRHSRPARTPRPRIQ